MTVREELDLTAEVICNAQQAGHRYVTRMVAHARQEAADTVTGRPRSERTRIRADRAHSEFLEALGRLHEIRLGPVALEIHRRATDRASRGQLAAIRAACRSIGGDS